MPPVRKLAMVLDDLARLDTIRKALSDNDPRGQFAALGMQEVLISDHAVAALVDVVARQLAAANRPAGKAAKLRLMVDPVTIRRDGRDLKADVLAQLAAVFDVTRVVVDDGHPILHADEPILDLAAKAAVGADCIVSVGGGTITDVAKVAAERAGVPVHVVVQTAASVDGYTDNFAVVLQNGVKKTLPSRWPEAVLADTTTIAQAPQYLNASGFGELMSMYCAPGDWFLAAKLGMDDTFTPVLLQMFDLCGEGIETWSAGVRQGDPVASDRLAKALAMRGIVTGVGGTTASLSGMEHLFSHMLDMVAGERATPTGLHGAQVGVGSVLRAAAWEEFCHRMAQTPVAGARLFADPESYRARVHAAFAELDPSGRIGAECWPRYLAKLNIWQAARPQIEAAFADWAAVAAEHDSLVFNAEKMALYLHRAGANLRASDLDPPPSADLTRWVVGNCQFMRERFTVADLLMFAGWWDDAGVARVLARAEAAIVAAEGGQR